MNYCSACRAKFFSASDDTGKHDARFIIHVAVCSLKVCSHVEKRSPEHYFCEKKKKKPKTQQPASVTTGHSFHRSLPLMACEFSVARVRVCSLLL